MKKSPITIAHSPVWLWLPILAALGLALVLGSSASVARAASPATPADCGTPTGTLGPVTINDWIGGDMSVSLTGGGCSATGQVTVDNKGVAILSFPAGTSLQPGVVYGVSGSASVNLSVQVFGQCVVLSITCSITGGTFMIDASGVEHFNGAISCLIIVPFGGIGPFSYGFNGGGNGTDPPAATPELSSSGLVAIGLVPTLIILYRRRRRAIQRESDEN